MIRAFLIALQFLTRLPVRLRRQPEARELGRSLLFYPLVGLIIGLLLALLALLAERLAGLPFALHAALLLVVWVLLTGALHLDGLADTCDAWAGGRGDRERTLAIMKDPRSGPSGVTAVVLVLLVKFAALQAVLEADNLMSLVLAPVLGRAALPLLFLTTRYVRPGGLGAALATNLPRKPAIAIVILSGAALPFAAGAIGWTALLAAGAAFIYLRASMQLRIGGATGDTAGALVEITEVMVLVVVSLILALWPDFY